jgi:hypothetical protein
MNTAFIELPTTSSEQRERERARARDNEARDTDIFQRLSRNLLSRVILHFTHRNGKLLILGGDGKLIFTIRDFSRVSFPT